MEQKTDNLYLLCLFTNDRIRLSKKMDTNELSLFREHCFGDAEVVKRKFTNKYRLPYICSECMEELGLCMGDKNVAYFRHSSSNIGCGGV